MVELGQISLLLALFLCSYAILVDILGSSRKDLGLIVSGRNATLGYFACLSTAMFALWTLLMNGDFSVVYVAENTSKTLPMAYKFSALWAGAAGSLLLWLWMQVGFMVLVFSRTKSVFKEYCSHGRIIGNLVSVFFIIILIFDQQPFETMPNPVADGAGLNPLLQHPAMVLHPPLLFVGYAAFMVPFAWTFARLKHDDEDAQVPLLDSIRKWTVFAWLFLTAGIVLGAWWAYEELGWGGYWAWDPVENSSLMPWLTGTALLHCFRIYNNKNKIATWTSFLCVITFSLCVFGRYLTKSGVITSVHTFGDKGLSHLYLVLLAHVFAIASILAIRRAIRRSGISDKSIPSGHKFFVWNNWLFVLITVVIWVGTMFPFLTRHYFSIFGMDRPEVSVDPEFFTKMTAPFGLLLLLLIALCPHLLKFSLKITLRTIIAAVAVIAVLVTWLQTCSLEEESIETIGFVAWWSRWLMSGSPAIPCLIFAGLIIAYLLADVAGYETAIARARKGGSPGKRSMRWYGARVVHLGIAMMFVGLAGSGLYDKEDTEDTVMMVSGGKAELGDYELVFNGFDTDHGDHVILTKALISVYRQGEKITDLEPATARYMASGKSYSEIDVRRTLAGDLYLALTQVDASRQMINLKIMIKPLINWIWIGSFVAAFGTLFVLGSLFSKKQPATQVQRKM